MSRLGHHRQRASRSPACKAKPKIQKLTSQHTKTSNPAQRQTLRQKRAWLTINSLTESL